MDLEKLLGDSVLTSRLEDLFNWGRQYSLWPLPFGTACCGIEYMSVVASVFDVSRFGAEVVRFSPRQSDLLIVAGTINYKQAPILKQIYDQMAEPKWVISMGVCASSGGFYDNYCVVQGIDEIIPVDVYIGGCPPRPEAVLDAIALLQKKVAAGVPSAAERSRQVGVRRPASGERERDLPLPARVHTGKDCRTDKEPRPPADTEDGI